MNKHLTAALLALSVIATPASALASNFGDNIRLRLKMDNEEARKEYKDSREDAREDYKERRASTSAEFKAELSARKKEQVRAWWSRVNRRLTAVINRLYTLADKIGARLDRLAANGNDVSKQKTELAAARVKIDVVKQELASSSAQVETILNTNNSKDAFKKLRAQHKEVLDAVREAHKALVLILGSTRGLSATPTP